MEAENRTPRANWQTPRSDHGATFGASPRLLPRAVVGKEMAGAAIARHLAVIYFGALVSTSVIVPLTEQAPGLRTTPVKVM